MLFLTEVLEGFVYLHHAPNPTTANATMKERTLRASNIFSPQLMLTLIVSVINKI